MAMDGSMPMVLKKSTSSKPWTETPTISSVIRGDEEMRMGREKE